MILLVKIGYEHFIIPEKHRDAAIAVLGSLTPVKEGGGYSSKVYTDVQNEANIEIRFIPESCYRGTTSSPELIDKILELEKAREKASSEKYAAESKARELEKKLASLPAPEPVKAIEPEVVSEDDCGNF